MGYFENVNRAIELTVITDDISGVTYLEPRYREVLREYDVHLDGDLTDEELYEILHLEVDKRNAMNNRSHGVSEWVYNVLVNGFDEITTQEQNELIKNLTEYMQLKETVKDKEKKLDEKERALDIKEGVKKIFPYGVNFAKKG